MLGDCAIVRHNHFACNVNRLGSRNSLCATRIVCADSSLCGGKQFVCCEHIVCCEQLVCWERFVCCHQWDQCLCAGTSSHSEKTSSAMSTLSVFCVHLVCFVRQFVCCGQFLCFVSI